MRRKSRCARRERATGRLGVDIRVSVVAGHIHLPGLGSQALKNLGSEETHLIPRDLLLADGECRTQGGKALLIIEQEQRFFDDQTRIEAGSSLAAEDFLGLGRKLDVHSASHCSYPVATQAYSRADRT